MQIRSYGIRMDLQFPTNGRCFTEPYSVNLWLAASRPWAELAARAHWVQLLVWELQRHWAGNCSSSSRDLLCRTTITKDTEHCTACVVLTLPVALSGPLKMQKVDKRRHLVPSAVCSLAVLVLHSRCMSFAKYEQLLTTY